jgi:hypothetical protein
MAKRVSYSKRADNKGHISCTCKTAFPQSTFERTNIGSSVLLKKSMSKKAGTRKLYPHQYKVEKGTKLSIGSFLNECSCSLFSGKARGGQFRPNRKDPSSVRARKLKNINSVSVRFT